MIPSVRLVLYLASFQACLVSVCTCQVHDSKSTVIWRDQTRCGINTTYLMLRINHIDASYEQVLSKLGPSDFGTPIDEMSSTLNSFGLNTKVFKGNPDNLQTIPLPFIAFMEPRASVNQPIGHYNLLLDIQGDRITYIEGTSCSILTCHKSEFLREWSGISIFEPKGDSSWALFYALAGGSGALLLGLGVLLNRTKKKCIASILLAVTLSLVVVETSVTACESDLLRFKSALQMRQAHIETRAVISCDYYFSLSNWDSSKPGDAFIRFTYDGNKRFIVERPFHQGTGSADDNYQSFDGKTYKSRQGRLGQIHSVESAKQLATQRFINLDYLNFIGISLRDPLANEEQLSKAERQTIKWRLKVCDFEIVDVENSSRFWLKQVNHLQTGTEQDDFLVDICVDRNLGYSIVKCVTRKSDNTPVTETICSSFRKLASSDFSVPFKVTHRALNGFNSGVNRVIMVREFDLEFENHDYSVEFRPGDFVSTVESRGDAIRSQEFRNISTSLQTMEKTADRAKELIAKPTRTHIGTLTLFAFIVAFSLCFLRYIWRSQV